MTITTLMVSLPSDKPYWLSLLAWARISRRTGSTRAKQAASNLAFGKEVTIQTYDYDKYKRTIGDVILPDGMNLNQELVKQGWCWWHRKYAPSDAVLEELEKAAREAKKGLWADPHPAPPWVYCKARRGEALER